MGKKVIFLAKNKEFPFRVFRGSSSGEYPISNKEYPMMKQEGSGYKLVLGQIDYCVLFQEIVFAPPPGTIV